MLVHSFMVYNCAYARQPPYMRLEISEEYCIVLYSSIYIAPLNSHRQTEALLVRLAPRKEKEYTQKLLLQGLAVLIFVLYCAYSHSAVCQFDMNIKQIHMCIN